MPRLSVWMIRTALVHLLVGFTLGALLLANKGVPIHPMVWRLLPIHIELLLLGWTLQLALGVARDPLKALVQGAGMAWRVAAAPCSTVVKDTSPTAPPVCRPSTRTRFASVIGVSGWFSMPLSFSSALPTKR